jgi:hypothetical protein
MKELIEKLKWLSNDSNTVRLCAHMCKEAMQEAATLLESMSNEFDFDEKPPEDEVTERRILALERDMNTVFSGLRQMRMRVDNLQNLSDRVLALERRIKKH